MTATTRTSADGTFALTGVQPGKYLLRAAPTLSEVDEVYFDATDGDVGALVVRIGPRR